MQRRERNIALEIGDHLGIHLDRTIVVRPAMNDAMTDGDQIEALCIPQPRPGRPHGGGDVWDAFRRIGLVDQEETLFGPCARSRGRDADAVEFAFHEAIETCAALVTANT